MATFTENEKAKLLNAAESQNKLHTYLMGMNGEKGFCHRIDEGLLDITKRHNKLERKFWWLVGILLGSGVITGSAIGLGKLIN